MIAGLVIVVIGTLLWNAVGSAPAFVRYAFVAGGVLVIFLPYNLTSPWNYILWGAAALLIVGSISLAVAYSFRLI